MIEYITVVAEDEMDVGRAKKLPFVVNEILGSDGSPLLDKVIDNTDLLTQLWGFYQQEPQLNLVLAGYVSQVMT
jgi:hypothetical protein